MRYPPEQVEPLAAEFVVGTLHGAARRRFESLMRAAYLQTFPPHVDLIAEGEPSDFLHILLSGSVDLYASWNGRETSLATVRPVSTFILAATIRDAPYLMSARTLAPSRILMIPSENIRTVFERDLHDLESFHGAPSLGLGPSRPPLLRPGRSRLSPVPVARDAA